MQSRWGLFLWLLCGQTISTIGSYQASFALRVFVLTTTDLNVGWYALLGLAESAPSLLAAPIAGWVADHWNRKLVVIGTDLGAALTTVYLLLSDSGAGPTFFVIFLASFVTGTLGAFQSPVWSASTSLLIAPDELPKANGLSETSAGIAQLLVPSLAGFLVLHPSVGLRGILWMDLISCLVAVTSVALSDFPTHVHPPSRKDEQDAVVKNHENHTQWSYTEATAGLRLIWQDPNLFALLLLLTVDAWVSAFVFKLIPALVLSFQTQDVFGYICSISGCGVLVGGIALNLLPSADARADKDQQQPHSSSLQTSGSHIVPQAGKSLSSSLSARFVAVAIFLQGLVMMSALWPPSVLALASTGFVFLMMGAIESAHATAVFQTRVPLHAQGRVFACKSAILRVADLLAVAMSGPLADWWLEPAMASSASFLGSTAGAVMGVGKGRGFALLFVALGVVEMTAAIFFAVGFVNGKGAHRRGPGPSVQDQHTD